MNVMKSSRTDVQNVLNHIKEIISSSSFDITRNLVFVRHGKEEREMLYSTTYTLMELEFDEEDVLEVLGTLTVEDYSHTKLDLNDLDPPHLLVFSKVIHSKEVYIKIKVRSLINQVVCISFHFAKYPLNKPYER